MSDHSPNQFRRIAAHYDKLMADVPYGRWVDYIADLLRRIDYTPRSALDVACGTGAISELLSRRGLEVVGVDISPDMIEIARSRGSRVDYHVQDAAELDLGRRFDLAVSLFDSLNYITDVRKLRSAICRVAEHLEDGGVFIFDVNTVYALSHHFFDQANLASSRYPKYVWNSDYDHSTRICTVKMTFEVIEDGQPVQFQEVHVQRGHSLEELTEMLVDAQFEVVEVFEAYRFRKPTRRTDRVYYVARRRSRDTHS